MTISVDNMPNLHPHLGEHSLMAAKGLAQGPARRTPCGLRALTQRGALRGASLSTLAPTKASALGAHQPGGRDLQMEVSAEGAPIPFPLQLHRLMLEPQHVHFRLFPC